MRTRITFTASVSIILLLLMSGCCKTKKTYYPQGNLESEIRYCRQQTQGKAIWYYENGNKRLEAFYIKGLLEGEMKRYHSNGHIESIYQYAMGILEDTSFTYNQDGKLIQKCTNKNGVKNGPFYYYYPDGQEQVKGFYVDDQYEGLWQYFDEEGFLVGEGQFSKGAGMLKRYNAEGKTIQSRTYEKSSPTGKEIHYDREGNIIRSFSTVSIE